MKATGHQVCTPVMHCLWQRTPGPEESEEHQHLAVCLIAYLLQPATGQANGLGAGCGASAGGESGRAGRADGRSARRAARRVLRRAVNQRASLHSSDSCMATAHTFCLKAPRLTQWGGCLDASRTGFWAVVCFRETSAMRC